MAFSEKFINLLCCPVTGESLRYLNSKLESEISGQVYEVSNRGIPLFIGSYCSQDAVLQQQHYDSVAKVYLENLTYPHTQEYMRYLDDVFYGVLKSGELGTIAEICCGKGEALHLLRGKYKKAVGIDISQQMLISASNEFNDDSYCFIQGDATILPLVNEQFDNVFMLGGIHHVSDRKKLFTEVFRILKPGGRFYFREPVSDFFLWRWIRAIIYRVSPALDANTERPLLWKETVPVLEEVGFELKAWKTCGFFGFCVFMNSDVLVFNRLFRFIPGIRLITRLSARIDDLIIKLPGLSRIGLQVSGVAERPVV